MQSIHSIFLVAQVFCLPIYIFSQFYFPSLYGNLLSEQTRFYYYHKSNLKFVLIFNFY